MTTKDDIERLSRKHYAAMYRLAMLELRDDDVSRDIVHDVFEALLVSDRTDVSGAYLLAAVRNRCLKHIRSLSALDRMKAVYSVDEKEIEEIDSPKLTYVYNYDSCALFFMKCILHSIFFRKFVASGIGLIGGIKKNIKT